MTPTTSEPTLLAYLAQLHEDDYAEWRELLDRLAPILLGVPGAAHRAVMHAVREGALPELLEAVAAYQAERAQIDAQMAADARYGGEEP